ncbi:MAG TPA: hypothetical protein VGN52_08825 [Burkholderiales bacterium]
MNLTASPTGAPQPWRTQLITGLWQGLAAGLVLTAAALPLVLPHPRSLSVPAEHAAALPRHADFGATAPAPEVRQVANWVAQSGDAGANGYLIVDKKNARLYVFDAQSHLQGNSTVLLGLTPGDDLPPLAGSTPLSKIHAAQRTTPAGRFDAQRGHDDRGDEVVWVDYAAALAMHRVHEVNAGENRLARLDSADVAEKRISYGCINVPAAFFDQFIHPLFAQRRAMIYVLPEVKPLGAVFKLGGATHRTT